MNETAQPILFGDPAVVATPEALSDRRELATIAFERTRMPMVVTDPRQPDNPIVMANHAFLVLTGYTADEVIGRNCRFLQGPQTSSGDVDEIRKGVSAGGETSVELLNYRKDGTTFWNRVLISPVRDEKGSLLYYFGSQMDVTAGRRVQELEAAERLLLMEVDHRAMNAMALVQSIIRLSCPADAPGYVAAIQGRVDALARAHRLLGRNRWSETEFRDVLTLGATQHSGRIDAEGPSMPISAQIVQPLALVLHEMLSNAVSHGALSHPNGAVMVRWREQDDQALVSWCEQGAIEPCGNPEPGFGLSMIAGVIGRQLGGTTSLNWTSAGLEAELVFPRSRAVSG